MPTSHKSGVRLIAPDGNGPDLVLDPVVVHRQLSVIHEPGQRHPAPQAVAPTIKRLGIRYRKPYQCRHTNATMRLMAGQRLGYAAQQMGHTVDMFVHTYTRWINDGHSSLEDQKLEQFLALETPGIAMIGGVS